MFFVGGWVEQQYIQCFWIPCFLEQQLFKFLCGGGFVQLFVGRRESDQYTQPLQGL